MSAYTERLAAMSEEERIKFRADRAAAARRRYYALSIEERRARWRKNYALRKERLAEMSEEALADFYAKKAEAEHVRYHSLSDEEKSARHRQTYERHKQRLAEMSDVEKEAYMDRRNELKRKQWAEMSEDDKKAEGKKAYARYKARLAKMSDKELKAHRKQRAAERRELWRRKRQALLWTFGMEANWICYICGDAMDMSQELHLDHIESESKGGSSEWWNRQLSHGYCNQIKGERSLQDAHDYLFDNPDLLELRYMTPAMAMSEHADKLAPPFYGKP